MEFKKNPVITADYPDPDIIRVEDTYYLVSTTMYFMPGAVILRSYDLLHWEFCSYVFEKLESTPEECLKDNKTAYSHGMWAPCLRFHQGKYYIIFIAHEFDRTFLFTSDKPEGPWNKSYIEGIYHDPSLLFDDDGKIYLVYGGRNITLLELKEDLSGPKPNGLNKIIIRDAPGDFLGYEGSHIYKINGRYLLFLIHSLQQRWFRTQACFISDHLEEGWAGGDVMCDDMGFFDRGVAQGGIVDTPDGQWFSFLFQDRGAAGRFPVLVPVRFNQYGYPVYDGVPATIKNQSTRPGYKYEPLYSSDDFSYKEEDNTRLRLKPNWEFNHEPDDENFSIYDNAYHIITNKISNSVEHCQNTLTQRMMFPCCNAEVSLDTTRLKNGDLAGFCALQGCYGLIGISRENNQNYIVMKARMETPHTEAEYERIHYTGNCIKLKIEVDFTDLKDEVQFFWWDGENWIKAGITHKLVYTLEHFTGCRFALFHYATREIGGESAFMDFIYDYNDESDTISNLDI